MLLLGPSSGDSEGEALWKERSVCCEVVRRRLQKDRGIQNTACCSPSPSNPCVTASVKPLSTQTGEK